MEEQESGTSVQITIKKSSSTQKLGYDITIRNNSIVEGHKKVLEQMAEDSIKIALKAKIALEGGM